MSDNESFKVLPEIPKLTGHNDSLYFDQNHIILILTALMAGFTISFISNKLGIQPQTFRRALERSGYGDLLDNYKRSINMHCYTQLLKKTTERKYSVVKRFRRYEKIKTVQRDENGEIITVGGRPVFIDVLKPIIEIERSEKIFEPDTEVLLKILNQTSNAGISLENKQGDNLTIVFDAIDTEMKRINGIEDKNSRVFTRVEENE